MINTVVEQLITNKSIDQYKVIEDRYYTLRRFLSLWFESHSTLEKNDIDVVLDALEPFEVDQTEAESEIKEESKIEEESEEINND